MSEISLLPRRRIISKPKLPPSHQAALLPASLSRHHIPPPRRLCRQANRPRLHLGPSLSVPAPSRQRPTFVGLVPCLAARKRKAHRGLPLCTICIGALLLYRFGSFGKGHSVAGGRSGCHRSPTFSSDKAELAGSAEPRRSFALAFCGGGCVLI